MLEGGGQDFVEHGGHASLLMPAVTRLPALGRLESFAIGITGMLSVPGFFRVLAEAERTAAVAVIENELHAEDVDEQLVDLITGEDLVDHAQDILAVRAVEAGHVPARPRPLHPALGLTLVVHPGPIGMSEHALVVELQAIVGARRHPQLVSERDLGTEEVAIEMRMADGDVARIVSVAPVVLRV